MAEKCGWSACVSGLVPTYNPVYKMRAYVGQTPYEMVLGLKICDACRPAVAKDLREGVTPQVLKIAEIAMRRAPRPDLIEIGWAPISEHAALFKKDVSKS